MPKDIKPARIICPYCTNLESEVMDTRGSINNTIRRRRECTNCRKRFTTRELLESEIKESLLPATQILKIKEILRWKEE